MNPQNPYNSIVEELSLRIHRSLFLRGLTIDLSELMSEVIEPPSREMGDLGIALHKYAKRLGLKPDQLAEETKDFLNDLPGLLCAKAISGYLNVTYSPEYIAKVTISSVKNVENYGYVPSKKTLKIVVEHTSANPIHPLHIGHGRNALLGDTLYRLLTNRGHLVQRRFYINDTGRQVALLAFGYKLIGRRPPENAKPDEWLGKLYALTNLLIELRSIESTLSKLRNESKSRELSELEEEKYRELLRKADEIAASLGRLWEEDKELFDEVSKALMEHKGDPEEEILKIMSSYERGEEWAKSLVREVVDRALAGIRETLSKLGVEFDKWDYESDLVWSGLVNEVVSKALSSPLYIKYKGADALDVQRIASQQVLGKLNIDIRGEIPPLVIRRSDGTLLYTTKDIAYSIYKFADFNADLVINVIGAEQKLPQTQLKLALLALGYVKEAENLVTYIYEMVIVPGLKMSSRRYQIVTLDWLLEELYRKARDEVDKRRQDLSESDRARIAWTIAVAATRFSMTSYDPLKPLNFNLNKVLDLSGSSAPYILYTHARASNILKKAGSIEWDLIDYSYARNEAIKELAWLVMKYPQIAVEAADKLSPEILGNYIVKMADYFNKWYESERIIDEEDKSYRALKLAIVLGVKKSLAHGLKMFGVTPLDNI